MKLSVSIVTTLLVALAKSSPIEVSQELQDRASYGTTSNEYVNKGCNDVILWFARGSTQSGNVVCEALPASFEIH
jgi:cutinase